MWPSDHMQSLQTRRTEREQMRRQSTQSLMSLATFDRESASRMRSTKRCRSRAPAATSSGRVRKVSSRQSHFCTAAQSAGRISCRTPDCSLPRCGASSAVTAATQYESSCAPKRAVGKCACLNAMCPECSQCKHSRRRPTRLQVLHACLAHLSYQ